MEKTLFDDLLLSLKQAKAISHGEMDAGRRTVRNAQEVKAIRENAGLSQNEFAKLIRVSIKTLQNWEQSRRSPSGPAAALLQIFAFSPKLALKSLHARAA
jgi:DNA-binding transcriptional regulator YiaG